METERLEAAILRTIVMIKKSHDLNGRVSDQYLKYCAKLRNQIAAYRLDREEVQIDDLMFAMIRDDALNLEQIQFCFDLDDTDFASAILRMHERNR